MELLRDAMVYKIASKEYAGGNWMEVERCKKISQKLK